jgi:dTDP-4-dehydrorhamnose reductase
MILVLGASGNVGSAICKLLHANNVQFAAPTSKDLDITNQIGVRAAIKDLRPSHIVNCVARTNVDWCEDNKEEANLVNGVAVDYIGVAAKIYRAKLIHLSTDYVFDGKKDGVYTEEDIPNPVQEYGRSKLLGEQNALKHEGVVARVQWVLGMEKSNFVTWIMESIVQKKEAKLSTIQFGSPCSAEYISKNLYFLMALQVYSGIFHITHDDFVNRYDCATYISSRMGIIPSHCVLPVDSVAFGKAERPVNTRMSNAKLKRHFGDKEKDLWVDDINQYLIARYGR